MTDKNTIIVELLDSMRQQLQKILVADLSRSKNDQSAFTEVSDQLNIAINALEELHDTVKENNNGEIVEQLKVIEQGLKVYSERGINVEVDVPEIVVPAATVVQETKHVEEACKLLFQILDNLKSKKDIDRVRITNKDPQDAIPVVLTTASRQAFYTAIVQAMAAGGGDATSANQTGGNQKTQIVDAGGEVATVTGGNLDVNATIPGLTAMTNSQLDISTTQVAVPTSNLAGRKTIAILALAANAQKVYVGLTGVSSTNGFELSAGNAVEIDVNDTVNLFCIAASGTQRISITEVA